MTDLDEMKKKYLEQEARLKAYELNKAEDTITAFISHCTDIGIPLKPDHIDYIQTTGIVAKYPGLLSHLCPELSVGKDGLVSMKQIRTLFKPAYEGYFNADNFTIMLSPLFRRGCHEVNNWAPRFVDLFCSLDDPDIRSSILLDVDRVRINMGAYGYFEADTWFGPPFNDDITKIPDGISHLQPPLDLQADVVSSLFKDAYALDISWQTSGTIKTFQAYEFKSDKIAWDENGSVVHPSRYAHAEFDLETGSFRHFDGAMHYFSPEDYRKRRDANFVQNQSGRDMVKAESRKMFRFDGFISVDIWKEFLAHFFTGNPLTFEYFCGAYPDHLQDSINRLRSNKDVAG